MNKFIQILIIFVLFTLICINWKYWNLYYYVIFIPIYILYFYYIRNSNKIYLILKQLTISRNIEELRIDLTKKYSISHIGIGIILNIFLIFLYVMINKLSITQCEFISYSKKQILSHFTLICESNKLQINMFTVKQNNILIYYIMEIT